ncbi:hypothetical protein HAZELMIKA_66 [Klebsiella phage vB_KaeD_HazelMika]|nr:hypothetical protein HAZELMIKA_66 [Klebsiella phage vB_KaeD_HazelMika]
MKTFESVTYYDEDGDGLQVDCHDTHVELTAWHDSGCWVGEDPKALREIAAQLIRGAEILEGGK